MTVGTRRRAVVAASAGDVPDIATSGDLRASLQAWKQRGVQAFDAIECRTIEALVERGTLHGERVRAIVETKARRRLGALVARFEQAADREIDVGSGFDADADRGAEARAGEADVAAPDEASRAHGDRQLQPPIGEPRHTLAMLLAHIASQQPLVAMPLPSRGAAASSHPELKTLSYFKGTWASLSADRRLRQSLSALPENAGPLNSQRLVHRAMQAMRELSPAYFERFVDHVDTLLWLDGANGGPPLAGKAVLHAEVEKGGKPEKKRTRR